MLRRRGASALRHRAGGKGPTEVEDVRGSADPRAGVCPVWPLLLLNGFGILLGWRFLNGSLGEWGGDNVQFLLLAEAMWRGHGYVELHLPGWPPDIRYPPVYPVLLVPCLALGAPLIVIKAFTALLGLVGVNVCYAILRRWHGPVAALLVCLATLSCGAFLDSGLSVMSESPFLLVSSLALLCLQRSLDSSDRAYALSVAAGILTGLSVLTRIIGVTLAPAAILLAGLTPSSRVPLPGRVRRLATVGLATVMVAGPWFVRAATVDMSGTAGYLEELSRRDATLETLPSGAEGAPGAISIAAEIAPRPVKNFWDFWSRLARTDLPEPIRAMGESWATVILYAILTACAVLAGFTLIGLVRGLWTHRRAHDFYVLSYLALLASWTGGGSRLLMPILPFLFGYLYEGGCWIGRNLRRPRVVGRVLLVLAIAGNLAVTTQFPLIKDRLAGRYAPWWSDLIRASCRLAEQAGPGERVIATPDNVVFYFSGLQAERPRVRNHTAVVLDRVLASGARYVILTPFEQWRFRPILRMLQDHPAYFSPLFTEGEVRVLRIDRDLDARSLVPGEPARTTVPSGRCETIAP